MTLFALTIYALLCLFFAIGAYIGEYKHQTKKISETIIYISFCTVAAPFMLAALLREVLVKMSHVEHAKSEKE